MKNTNKKQEILSMENDYYLRRVTAPKMVKYINALNDGVFSYYGLITDIYDAYKNPSIYKIRAWNYCKEMCNKYGGYNLKINSYNCQSFTCTFEFVHPIDGNLCVAYLTRDYSRFCDLI